jgi:hypothetical protein
MKHFFNLISLRSHIPTEGVIDYISLTSREVKCLDIALYFLSQQLYTASPHSLFIDYQEAHYHHLYRWLNHPALKVNLDFLIQESVLWPIMSTEDTPWLMLALEYGVIDQTLESLATDQALYECDMLRKEMMSLEESLSFVEKEKSFFSIYLKNYQKIAQVKDGLLAKLANIESV